MATKRRRRTPKGPAQQELFNADGTKKKSSRGGRRPGAGRKPKGMRAGSPHLKRPTLKSQHPVHTVLRVAADVRNLRKREILKALREATLVTAQREDFRIIHVSIQRNHVHLLVEAQNKRALSKGMQGFQISAAKAINAALSVGRAEPRRGSVFPDRYHQEIITTPRQARHALAYVLNNWRKHREDQAPFAKGWRVDPFSTGPLFFGWKEREHEPFMWRLPETYEPMFVWLPKTWLLSQGWRRHGLIRMDEVPSAGTKALVGPRH